MKPATPPKTISQEAHATAIEAARAEGEAAGEKKGAATAYARISEILADEGVKGRERAAVSLACKAPELSLSDIRNIVVESCAPRDGVFSLDQRMANADGDPVPVDHPQSGGSEPSFLARMKARHGVAA